MKTLLLAVIGLYMSLPGKCGLPAGHFEGALSRDGSIQLIAFDISDSEIRYTIPELGYFDVLAEKAMFRNDTLNIKFYYGNFFCFIDVKTGDITGISERWDPKIRLHVKKQGLREFNFYEEDIRFRNGPVILSGVLLKPSKHVDPAAYAILIHGSGNQDINTPYYHSLAYSLVARGIGVLIYDKRGCGKSSGNWQTANFFDLADDAVAAYKYLLSRKEIKRKKIGFLGSSQGGWITGIAATKVKGCSFAVLNVGPSVSLFEQDVHRVQYSMEGDGFGKNDIDSAITYSKLYFDYVRSNSEDDWEKLQRSLHSIKAKDWAEYLNIPAGRNDEDVQWWRINSFDPAPYLSAIKCPTLSLFGENDQLVPPSENIKKMDSLLKISGAPYLISTIKGTAHDMLTFQGLNGNNWKWPVVYWQWRRQPPEFIKHITDWILAS